MKEKLQNVLWKYLYFAISLDQSSQRWKMCPYLLYIALGAINTLIFLSEKSFLCYDALCGLVQWLLTPITSHYALWSRLWPSPLTGSDSSGGAIQVMAEKSQTLNRPNAPLFTIGEALSHTGYTLTQSFALDGTCMNCWGCSQKMLLLNRRDRKWRLEGGKMAETCRALKSFYWCWFEANRKRRKKSCLGFHIPQNPTHCCH